MYNTINNNNNTINNKLNIPLKVAERRKKLLYYNIYVCIVF